MTRGEIYWADYGVPFGSETGFRRPVIIMQSTEFIDTGIMTVVVVPLSTNLNLEDAPGNIFLDKETSFLPKDSVAVVSQITSIDKRRIGEKISELPNFEIEEIEDGICLFLDIKSK